MKKINTGSPDPIVVLMVAPPMELAKMQKRASAAGLPVARGMVTQSKNVPGLGGVLALSWVDGIDDPPVAAAVIAAMKEMINNLQWAYHQQQNKLNLARGGGGETMTMFDE